jgi:hypothetical protein
MVLSLTGLGVLGASLALLVLLGPRQGEPVVRGEAAEVLCGFLLTIAITIGFMLLVAGVAGENPSTLLSISVPHK